MSLFDDFYSELYYQVKYPDVPSDPENLQPGYLWVSPEERAKENLNRKAGNMLMATSAADFAAGGIKGYAAASVGLPGDILAIGRGAVQSALSAAFQAGKKALGGEFDSGKVLTSLIDGLDKGVILPTTEDITRWMDEYLPSVIPESDDMIPEVKEFRESAASAGQLVGEVLAPATILKKAVQGVKQVKRMSAGAKAK